MNSMARFVVRKSLFPRLLLVISPCLSRIPKAQELTITKGGTYSGDNITQKAVSFSAPAIYVDTIDPVTLEHDSIVTAGWGIIAIEGANLTIKHCYFAYNGTPDTWQPAKKREMVVRERYRNPN
jgi:hypothetical protein